MTMAAISGGTPERPTIQSLLAYIQSRKVDVVVVYKVDRLTRSLADFAELVELFEANGVSFVAVTQLQFRLVGGPSMSCSRSPNSSASCPASASATSSRPRASARGWAPFCRGACQPLLQLIGQSAGRVALFLTGLILSSQRVELSLNVSGGKLVKNIVHPLLAVGLILVLGLRFCSALCRPAFSVSSLACGTVSNPMSPVRP
jgi:hypothetical protein